MGNLNLVAIGPPTPAQAAQQFQAEARNATTEALKADQRVQAAQGRVLKPFEEGITNSDHLFGPSPVAVRDTEGNFQGYTTC